MSVIATPPWSTQACNRNGNRVHNEQATTLGHKISVASTYQINRWLQSSGTSFNNIVAVLTTNKSTLGCTEKLISCPIALGACRRSIQVTQYLHGRMKDSRACVPDGLAIGRHTTYRFVFLALELVPLLPAAKLGSGNDIDRPALSNADY